MSHVGTGLVRPSKSLHIGPRHIISGASVRRHGRAVAGPEPAGCHPPLAGCL